MEKYKGTFEDGFETAVWSASTEMAEFHFKDWERLHGKLINCKKVR